MQRTLLFDLDMITEDYVSFETAKLLKEKGFNWNTDKQFNLDKIVGDYNITDRSRHPERYLDAPTLQMAMKWLREVHKTYMYIAHDSMENTWFARVYNDYKALFDVDNHSTYEEACEAAIKYCLKNLI